MQYNKYILQVMPRIVAVREYSSAYKRNGGFLYTDSVERVAEKQPGYFEIIYCAEGKFSCSLTEQSVREGSVVCLPADSGFSLRAVTVPWRYYAVTVACEAAPETFRDTGEGVVIPTVPSGGENGRYPQIVLPECTADPATVSCVSSSLRSMIVGREDSTVRCDMSEYEMLFRMLARLTELSVKALRCEFSDETESLSEYSKSTLMFIGKHIGEKISVKDIAEEVGISYGHLSRTVKSELGRSPLDLVNKMKMDELKDILIKSNISFEDAGKAVGIDDTKYLSRLFKRYIGVTYTDFIKSLK